MNFALIGTELRLAIVALVLGAIGGLITGHWAISISLFLGGFVIWLLRQISRMYLWLENEAPIDRTPSLIGSTDQVISAVCVIKKQHAKQQEHLAELVSRFDAATGAMPDAMLVVDQNQNIEWANAAAANLLGIQLDRDIGFRVDNIVRDPLISSYLSAGDYSEPLEFASPGSAQNDMLLRVITYGDDRRLLCVHDHTDLLRLQQVRKAFIANASHEMRTPLTVIIGYLEALTLRKECDEATRRGIEGALEQSHRLKQLIEDLLSLSRLESLPLVKSKSTEVDIAALVKESVELTRASSVFNEHRFELSLENHFLVHGDDRELLSAVQNIIENAVKYSPPETLIKVALSYDHDEGGRLTVTDHGEGIDKEHIARLTERFYRVDKGRSRDKGGTGLGLSIVKHIMERHSGRLMIRSVLGSGTSVELCFPSHRIRSQFVANTEKISKLS